MLLSATIIARDEAFHLPGCLASISPVVDEVVVVDTGSADATVELARAAGATVALRPWDGSFAAARNAALDLARGEWILYIDADERLSDAGGLREALASCDAVAGLVRFCPGSTYTQYWEYRLFRNRPDIRFHGVIHETMVPDISRLVSEQGASVVNVPGRIDHLGYEGDQADKHRRNLPLLLRQIEDAPERLYLWFHLGSVHEGLADDGAAEAAWMQGLAVARRQVSPAPFAVLIYAKLALLRLRRGRDAGDLARELAQRFPEDPLSTWVSAHQAMFGGRWADAVPLLESLAAVDAASLLHPVLAYDRRMFEELGAHCLGLCWFHLGDDAEAERYFAIAAEAAPEVEEYRRKRQLCAARAMRSATLASHPSRPPSSRSGA
ncbi:MAG: glycosyltransferase family 2 protein [Actinomycetota bacterium]|nr:glycosyltransferase family 2 protein [Actinomycetota bacterium]